MASGDLRSAALHLLRATRHLRRAARHLWSRSALTDVVIPAGDPAEALRRLRAALGFASADELIVNLWALNHQIRPPIGRRVAWIDNREFLKCLLCHATWIGDDGETCSWCENAHERLRLRQAELDRQHADG